MANFEVDYYNAEKFYKEEETGDEKLLKNCLSIINTYESKKSRYNNIKNQEDMLAEFRSDFFEAITGNKNGCAFMLYQDNKPVSFCLFTNTDFDNDELHLEMIYTRRDYSGMGRGKMLLDYALKFIANSTNVKTVISAVSEKNDSSRSMHEHYINDKSQDSKTRAYYDNGRRFYEIDLNDFRNKEDVEELSK